MPEHDVETIRSQYNKARRTSEDAYTAIVEAAERAKRVARDLDMRKRRSDPDDQHAREELKKLEAQARDALGEVEKRRRAFKEILEAELAAVDLFAEFSNPIDGVGRLADDTPIALFPLRLEVRYRTIEQRRGVRRMFCVRVFPDDILVDTFQPEISEAELTNVVNYWVHRWRAGGDAAGRRAAWASLVRTAGAGRAKWLIDRVKPANAEPAINPGEHMLVIVPASPVPAGEHTSIEKFWARVWSTNGAERDQAFAALSADLGAARAAEIEETLVPANLRDIAVRPDPAIVPVVRYLDMPAANTLPLSRDAWTRAARTWMLPERLVLLGFRDGQLVLEEIGEPIPPDLQIGPDPSAHPVDQVHADGADLDVPGPLKWTVDFDAAVAKGMAFAVDVGERFPRFDRLFVLGVRLGSDKDEAAAELERLIQNHQASRKGFSLLPQGRPTNNTDGSKAAYSWWEDPAESYRHFFEIDPDDDPTNWRLRKDGAWLAGMLGIDRQVLKASPHYFGTDQSEARAMNVALWPATLGYYMEQMMEPVFSEQTATDTRAFFNRFVIGRGTVPLVRVGRQPYGILPTTVWSRMAWWNSRTFIAEGGATGLPGSGYLAGVYELTNRGVELWRGLAAEVANAGEPGDDRHQTLLSIVGLHPASVEFYQRFARSYSSYVNMLMFANAQVSALTGAAQRRIQAVLEALAEFGWTSEEEGELPDLLEKVFNAKSNLLDGPLVQAEVSDVEPLAIARADGLNYIAWLQLAARTSHDMLRRQEGFTQGVPRALLYNMLRHALDLGFVDAALMLRRSGLALSDAAYRAERKEPRYIHISPQNGASRWEALYRAEPQITGDATMRLGDFIPTVLEAREPYLDAQLSALDVLKTATSGSLERAFVEHLDCLTYRLDAWRLGIHAVQLSSMRGETETGFAKGGVYLGAYGWLEDVRPKPRALDPVHLEGKLATIFEDETPLLRDSTNYGHVHAPSLDHASAAAILRNGHLVNATPEEPGLLAVELTSERVRLARQMMEGIRNGQSLGALLGYRLERALHDEPDLFLDRLIYDLRRAFPLGANRNQLTKLLNMQKITSVEARNVVDGAELVEHIARTGATTYPYDVDDLPPLSDFTGPGLPSAAQIGQIIDGHVAGLRSVADAVADLQVAESVYQLVRGNYDRASATLDAFSKGGPPPVPEVVTTPRAGRTLTHRIGLHLPGGLPAADPASVPRAKSEPALARWLSTQLPDPATIFARVTWYDEASAADVSVTPSMSVLGLSTIDLFYMLDVGGDRDMPGFDELLIEFADRTGAPPPRHDATFTLEYKPDGVAGVTLFEVAPLVRALRGLVLGTRPLRPTDLALQNEASAQHDAGVIVRVDKAQAAVASLQAARPAIHAFVTALEAAIGAGVADVAARDAARDNVDQWMLDFAAAVRPMLRFGLDAAGLTAGIEARRPHLKGMREALDAIVQRWQTKEAEYDEVMAAYAALGGGATDQERIELLVRAGRTVSTTVIAPLPPTIPGLENAVADLRSTFDTALTNLTGRRDTAAKVGATLSSFEGFMATYATIDLTPLDLMPFRDGVLTLAQDLQQKAEFLREEVDKRLAAANAALARAATAAGDKAHAAVAEAAKAVFGDAFMLLCEFTLSNAQLAEWSNAWTDRDAMIAHLENAFAVDDWLIGVARVRERARHFESVTFLTEALGSADTPAIDAVQFPFRPHDVWLGLDFPATFRNGDPFALDEDKLLYGAVFGQNAAIDPSNSAKSYAGLLIDEWVELVPTDDVTTGLAFHFDRPASEAPQAILLATAPVARGAWRWADLVDTLHETLDFAKLRAVEPTQIDRTALGTLLPAIMSPVTTYAITPTLNLGFNNGVFTALEETT